MDSARFDALARSLSEGTTRRTLTRLLGGLAVGLLLHPIPGDAKQHGAGTAKGKKKTTATGHRDRKDTHHSHHPKRQKARPKAHPAEPTDEPVEDPVDDPVEDPTR